LRSSDDNADFEFTALYRRHVETVYRVCYNYLRNASDSEDAVQSVFIKLLSAPQSFASQEHEKAWLIRVAANHCKDLLKSSWNKRASLEAVPEPCAPLESHDDTLELVMALPEHLRVSIYLYYYEGYNAAEIAAMTGRTHSTVRNYLSDARRLLREKLSDLDD
jgi:RNA polymerase sigma-70 factor (ECF subfamily)